ncbi:MAG: cation-transporting P-type ATPase, partial [Sphingobacteriales bacterium]
MNNDTLENENGDLKGDSTEIALMRVAADLDIHRDTMERLAEIPFDSTRKLMTTFHPYESRVVAITKGAPDVLLRICNDIDPQEIVKCVDQMAAKGERVIGFAYKIWDSVPELDPAKVEIDLNFSGLAGLVDPPREEAGAAIEECKAAGIQIVMITGDHPETARNIATRLGILVSKRDVLLTGRELGKLSDEEFESRVEDIKVYARVSPEQKLNIVKALQKKGHYVAMTGDGVNDAPSLKRANIGIAMGITGTDVSREASDMVLMDDNFSTIVKAVREGRRIYDNILKFIKYLMTTNSGELFTLLIGPLLGLPIALLPIHILWINLVSDGLPAISLSFEKAERDIMQRPPRNPNETVFANGRGFHMIWVGLVMAAIALATQWWAIENDMPWQTMVFNVLCLSQLGHVLAIRSEARSLFKIGLFSNKPLLWAVLIGFVLQLALTYIPWLHPVFKT